MKLMLMMLWPFSLLAAQKEMLKISLHVEQELPTSAASGLVFTKDRFHVIADDERVLFTLQKNSKTASRTMLLSGELPVDKEQRKKIKPDFESLVWLSEKEWPPHGALVSWPSGSTLNRMTAIVLPFNEKNELEKPLKSNILSLAHLMNSNAKDLNIEGVLVKDKKVLLFQRGNSKSSKNGIFELSFESWIKGLKTSDWNTKVGFEKLKVGKLQGVRLGITDVVSTKFGVLALAAAEDTDSSYADGAVYGTVLVRLVGNEANILGRFDPVTKLEGIAVREEKDDGSVSLYLVDDADDPKKASKLYSATVKLQ